ncbi:ABC-2 family transporter protein [Pullulanibacillus sp. KACC 23026]|uniref:ABC transporter permease n=1 Tax=Pullulanibacillus sp. KACC 23026 TaxID=3028315 RepID=UPI0023B083C7|nr:ABC-2 family transporter protein [Pullulanibacillus sp. KACC 23026]WEG12184.1 ABC-2 family transporter protein [Pullulanibacillus sp. KACC 23026]
MSLIGKYMAILLKGQLQYRASFLLLALGQFLTPFSLLAGVYILFAKFGEIKGYSFYEVGLCFAIIQMSFAISECLARGFDSFSSLVVSGDFDRLLVRPRNTILQVIGTKFEFTRIGRFLQSIVVLIWVLGHLSIHWDLIKAVTVVLMVLSGVFIFTGIFILAATMCFWTIESIELANIFTDGGRELAQYPINIYKKWVTRFFTFVIPFGCANYLPLLFLLGKTKGPELLYACIPLAGILFIFPCLLVWQIGVRYYRSTGS